MENHGRYRILFNRFVSEYFKESYQVLGINTKDVEQIEYKDGE